MATHSSILAWRSPWREEPGRLQSTGLQRVGHDWATSLLSIDLFLLQILKISDWKAEGSVLFSGSVLSDSLRPHQLQHTRPPCPSPTPGLYSNPCPLSRWCHPTLSSSSPSAFNLSQHLGLFKWVNSLYQVTKVLEFQLQHQSFQWILRTDFL